MNILKSNLYSVKYVNHVLANTNSVVSNLTKFTVILSKSRKVYNTQKHLP